MSGWSAATMPAKAVFWVSAMLSWNVIAETAEDDFPDLELLEFIAEWHSDGEPVDPDIFAHEPALKPGPDEDGSDDSY